MLSPSLIVLPTDVRAAAVALYDANGNQLSGFDPSRPANATVATFPATNADQLMLAANPARRQVIITNEASKTLYLAFDATVSATHYTYAVAGGQTVTLTLDGYTGLIHAMLASGTGNVRVTEVTT